MKRRWFVILVVVALVGLWWLRPKQQALVGSAGTVSSGTQGPGVIVVDFQDNLSAEAIAELEVRLGIDLEYSSLESEDEALMRATVADRAAVLSALRALPEVEAAEPLIELKANGYPNDPLWEKQWNLRQIDAPFAWRASQGAGVRVAVLDTGISPVEDLLALDAETSRSFVPNSRGWMDEAGHGTHVAGTIAQATHNGLGVAGVAQHVTLISYRVLGPSGFGQSDWIAAAIDAATDDGVDVINMSLGSSVYSKVIHVAIQKAVARGIVVVAAAGNTGRQGLGYPGRLKEVIGVAAVGPDGTRAPYSSFGKGVELAAPGGDLSQKEGGILQSTIDGEGGSTYRALQGTSMAAPHVTGAVAVLKSMGLSGPAAVNVLLSSARTDTPGQVQPTIGYGQLDLGAAVKRVQHQYWGRRFAAGGFLAGILALLASLPLGMALRASGVGAMTAGGLFLLPWMPIAPNLPVQWLSKGILEWPAAFGFPHLVSFPLWASAALPLGLCFFLGLTRGMGAMVAAFSAGFGGALIAAAWTGAILPWWLGSFGTVWLMGNGIICLVAAMTVFLAQREKLADA